MSVLLATSVPTASAAPAAGVAVPACDRAGPCVVVQVLSGDEQVGALHFFYADQVVGQGDVSDTSYPRQGGTDVVVSRGSSLHRLVAVALDGVAGSPTYAEVVWNDAYQRHLLTEPELGAGSDAGFDGGLVPTFYTDDPASSPPQYFSYIRPQRDPGDPNASPGPDLGTTTTDRGGSLLVRVHLTGGVLDPVVTATPSDATRRTWALSTDQSGAGTTFDWVLPGSVRSTEAAPTYTFPDDSVAGTYPATVGVGRADGSFGWGSADLRAGDPPPAQPTAPTTGPGGGGSASAGPTKKPTATLSADPNPTASGTGPAVPSAAPTSAPTAPQASGSAAGPTARPTRTPSATPTSTPAAGGASVQGVLLAAAQPVEPAGVPVTADAPRPSPSAAPLVDAPFRVATAVWVVGGGVLLLLAGAASENEQLRRRVWRRLSHRRRRSP